MEKKNEKEIKEGIVEQKKEKRKFNDTFIGTILLAYVVLLIGELIGMIVTIPLEAVLKLPEKYEGFFLYFATIGNITAILLYIRKHKENHYMFKKLSFKASHFLIGLAMGFTMNIICAVAAMLHKDLVLTIGNFNVIGLIIAFFLVCIQSTGEELLCRLFVYQKLKKNFKNPLVWILGNSIFFGALHLGNEGITIWSFLDISIYGILMSLVIYYFDSFWTASAIHTSWNFTQNFLLGLPNSGMPATFSLYKIVTERNSFFYDTVFGVEGTVFCVILITTVTLLIYLLFRKKGEYQEDKEVTANG